jgi:hypothetical protein
LEKEGRCRIVILQRPLYYMRMTLRRQLNFCCFHFLRAFPKRNIHIPGDAGKNMLAERKILSSESV